MASSSLSEQLIKYLTDVHAMEVQALAQMRKAPDLAGDPDVAAAFEAHLKETERHEQLVRARLKAHDASPSRIEDLLGKLSGKGFVLFAQANPDTPGKLATHAYSYEHMELAAYDLLERVAKRAGDEETAAVAREIRAEEEAMAIRIGESWDKTVAASLRDREPGEHIDDYLADAHALETQSATLLDKGPKLAADAPSLASVLENHHAETQGHLELLERRLDERGSSPSRLKDASLKLGGLNWGGFWAANPDTPAKLAMFAYAVEHLEIGAYEQLTRTARLAGDGETAMIADTILPQERAAAEFIFGTFDAALDASLGDLAQRG
jgi:ferritin-like metal-binding protein YciE